MCTSELELLRDGVRVGIVGKKQRPGVLVQLEFRGDLVRLG